MAYSVPQELSKSARFHIRATGRQAKLIRAAASRKDATLTEYILDSLCAQAEMDLADETRFMLPKDKWNAFLKQLDTPPKKIPGLARLFSHEPVAESR